MAFTEFVQKQIKKEIQRLVDRVPTHARDKVRIEYQIRGKNITVFECRVHWQDPDEWTQMPVAQLRYSDKNHTWLLYWQRANGKWLQCEWVKPTKNLKKLVGEIDQDSHAVFWG